MDRDDCKPLYLRMNIGTFRSLGQAYPIKRTRIASVAFRPRIAVRRGGAFLRVCGPARALFRALVAVPARQRVLASPTSAQFVPDYQLSWLSENREFGPTLGELGPNPLEFCLAPRY
jgi:hypothetical protein